MTTDLPSVQDALPSHKDLFYGGQWHPPLDRQYYDTYSPGDGQVIASVAEAGPDDVDAAVRAAHAAFPAWRDTPVARRAALLRQAADAVRAHAAELAVLDAHNTGNPVAEMRVDALAAAATLDYFAGIASLARGETIPGQSSAPGTADHTLHYTVREPLGVVARIVAFNHPVLFAGAKMAAPLAAGNTVLVKPPDQAPLSCLRLAEILADVFPPGVLAFLPGRPPCGSALTAHPLVRSVTLVGSVPTGKRIQRGAADQLKHTLFELGGKNALVAYPDADVDALVEGVVRGMNFTWAGQSCGSTSRAFLHASLHDEVLRRVCDLVRTRHVPGVPTDPATTMGPVISAAAQQRVLAFIESGRREGARLVLGGGVPAGNPAIAGGYFVEPTIFADVQPHMRIAREEIFGPVLSVFRWEDEDAMLRAVNDTPYGLTAAIYTQNVGVAHRTAAKVEAGFVWVNQVGRHFLGVPFGGYKESGGGREESLEELLSFTQLKSVNINLAV